MTRLKLPFSIWKFWLKCVALTTGVCLPLKLGILSVIGAQMILSNKLTNKRRALENAVFDYLGVLGIMCGHTLKDKFSTRVRVWGIYVHHISIAIKDIQLKGNI